jgi:prolyl-tRNA synthetase
MRATGSALCRRAGLGCRLLEADAGPGPSRRQALAVPAPGGDTEAIACEACGYAALRASAESRLEAFPQDPEMRPMQAVHGPGLVGVAPLAQFLGIPVWKTTKTLLFQADRHVVAVMVRGDCDVSDAKVRRRLDCRELTLAAPAVIRELTGAEVGYAGGVGLPASVRVLADDFTRERVNFECGANRTDYHNINVNWGRDLPEPEFGDFKAARPGDRCPRCDDGRLTALPSVIVGWLAAENAREGAPTYQDAGGRPRPASPARVTLNLTRLAVLAAEAHHDDAGLHWPADIAPYAVHLIGLNLEDEEVRTQAQAIYARLRAEGVEVLFDDRDARAGEKFSDADLFGIPVRLTVSKRVVKEGKIELRRRGAAAGELVTAEDALRAGGAASSAQPGATT